MSLQACPDQLAAAQRTADDSASAIARIQQKTARVQSLEIQLQVGKWKSVQTGKIE